MYYLCTRLQINMSVCLSDVVVSWLVRSTPDRAVLVRALAGNIVLCSWARHLTFTVPVSTQVYKWLMVGKSNAGGNPVMDQQLIHRRVEILLVASAGETSISSDSDESPLASIYY